MQEVLVKLNLVEERCYECNVIFFVDSELQEFWLTTKAPFYCPHGHAQSYLESEADKLRRELEACQADAIALRKERDIAREDGNESDRKLDRAQAALKRLRKAMAHRDALKGGPHAK